MVITLLLVELRANGIVAIPKLPSSLVSQDRDSLTSIVRERQASLAFKFRDLMTRGQSFQSSNEFRQHFYKDVIKLATDVSTRVVDNFRETDLSSLRKAVNEYLHPIPLALPDTLFKPGGLKRQARNFVDS